MLIPIVALSALAAYLLRNSWLFVPAIVNAIVNLWSLGVLSNYRGSPISGNYERVVGGFSMLTTALGLIFLITSFFVR